jgi:hypothetical protein
MEYARLFPPYTRRRHHYRRYNIIAYGGDDPKRAMAREGKSSSAGVLRRRSVLIRVNERVFQPFSRDRNRHCAYVLFYSPRNHFSQGRVLYLVLCAHAIRYTRDTRRLSARNVPR